MKAVFIGEAKEDKPHLKHIEIPKPGKGQVLVKVEAFPVRHHDKRIINKETFIPGDIVGVEGCGHVVELGEGSPQGLLGCKVAFMLDFTKEGSQGTWAQYFLLDTSSNRYLVFEDEVDYKQIVCAYVNPLTTLGLFDTIKKAGHKSVIIDGASSDVGHIFIKLCKGADISVIGIIRRKEVAHELLHIGATSTINSTDPNFEQGLIDIIAEHKPSAFLDCISGDLALTIIKHLPENSQVLQFGKLSTEEELPESITKSKNYSYFKMFTWADSLTEEERNKFFTSVKKDISEGGKMYGATIVKEYRMDEWETALQEFEQLASEGKVIVRPQL